jgi:hypothetical protein
METELVVVWNGTMGREYRPFTASDMEMHEPLEALPPKEPHECQWKRERQKVLDLMSDGQARKISAIGLELGITQLVLHGFMQRWRRSGVIISAPTRCGFVRLNRANL